MTPNRLQEVFGKLFIRHMMENWLRHYKKKLPGIGDDFYELII